MTLELILFIVCALYGLEYLFFLLGMSRARKRESSAVTTFPSVSIVVAARNEEENIVRCLESLVAQRYPKEKIEVIAVDDESDDRTLQLMDQVAATSSIPLHVISTTPEQSGLKGKARAIAQGIDKAKGEIIILTDADCFVDGEWAKSIAEYLADGADLYGGFTVVEATTPFEHLQQLDWLHLQAIASSSMSFNSPVGVVGNNMAFRKSAYEAIGGYRALPFSITEDFTLFLAMINNGCKAVYPCDYRTHVRTRPIETLQDVLRQKHRWGRGGMESTPHGYSILVVAFFMLCAICIAPFVSLKVWGIVWGTKFLADLVMLTPVFRELRLHQSFLYFLPFQFYFLAQALVVPVMIINPKVRWKGRVFDTVSPDVSVD